MSARQIDDFSLAGLPRKDIDDMSARELADITRNVVDMVSQDLGLTLEDHEECRVAAVRTILSADFWTSERLKKRNGHTTIRAR